MAAPTAVVVGSGPNGLAAAIRLAQAGVQVSVLEKASKLGGGLRTEELTLPGFYHDFCSAVHPMGVLSPYFSTLPLGDYGLQWVFPNASVAHPLDGEPAVIFSRSLKDTAASIGSDGECWVRLLEPYLKHNKDFIKDALAPLGIPKRPLLLGRFGLKAWRSAFGLAQSVFKTKRGRALFAGCAAHSILPLDKAFSAAVGLMFAITGHIKDWPVAAGGSKSIAESLVAYAKSLGVRFELNTHISSYSQLPAADAYLFDTDPKQLATICETELPAGYRKRLHRYNYGPGAFKLDWALQEKIPWTDTNIHQASTVHIGGSLEELALSERAAWEGRVTDKPFVLLCQQSNFDPKRAPEGQHTGYAYCHVPAGCDVDYSSYIEDQIERFAPGFRDTILAKKSSSPRDFFQYNPNYFGGAIAGGAADITQLFTRPVMRLNPYTTPNKKIYICSASSPPGGGVHGMCGFFAAEAALRRLN